MRRWIFLFLALAILISIAGALAPGPIDPAPYRPLAGPALDGLLAPNQLLREVELLAEGRLEGPEDVAVDNNGRIYCGLADGTIRRFALEGEEPPEIFASTGGRPLGLDFDANGTRWVADSGQGLLAIDPRGTVTVRSTVAEGVDFGLTDDVDAAYGGKVYFSDASWRFGPDEVFRDNLEAKPHGRLLEYDPQTDRTRVLLDGLYFANGAALASDESFVLVAETFRYRVRRYWLNGPDAGRDEVFADNLSGFPDGVSNSGRGAFWLALFSVRNPLLDRFVHPRRWLKKLLGRLPAAPGGAEPYGLVLEMDEGGKILRSLHDPEGERFPHVTSAEENDGYLYLGSVEGKAAARYRLR